MRTVELGFFIQFCLPNMSKFVRVHPQSLVFEVSHIDHVAEYGDCTPL